MTTSGQTYKELAIPYFKEVFQIIDDILSERGIPYYLVGVNAIALELLESGYKPSRGTKDIDFAIMISSIKAFGGVMELILIFSMRLFPRCLAFQVTVSFRPIRPEVVPAMACSPESSNDFLCKVILRLRLNTLSIGAFTKVVR